jgi:hypothetical protein
MRDCRGRVEFEFSDDVNGTSYQSVVPPQQQAAFKAAFCRDLARVEKFFIGHGWLRKPIVPPPQLGTLLRRSLFDLHGTDFSVAIGMQFPVSRSLVPASLGQRGRMEFPAPRAIQGQSATAHEITHVFFPNGSRLLAEGLAVYVQQLIGGNVAFPNFGTPLHPFLRGLTCPPPGGGQPAVPIGSITLSYMDGLATPSNLTLPTDGDSTHAYAVAGSFVEWLIETFGWSKFRKLYDETPLVPLERNGGAPGRWKRLYKAPLRELEAGWKDMIRALPCPT